MTLDEARVAARPIGPVTLDETSLTAWGESIGRTVEPPVFLALRGELGAGKSVLARAIARGAGVTGSMPSPTFNLVLRYDGRDDRVISHIDLFRLDVPDDVWELGWSELGEAGEIVIVEWPERAEALLPTERWDILIRPAADPLLRHVEANPVGRPPGMPVPS